MAHKGERTTNISFRLTPRLRTRAEQMAERSGLSLADWLRAVVALAVNQGAFAPRKARRDRSVR